MLIFQLVLSNYCSNQKPECNCLPASETNMQLTAEKLLTSEAKSSIENMCRQVQGTQIGLGEVLILLCACFFGMYVFGFIGEIFSYSLELIVFLGRVLIARCCHQPPPVEPRRRIVRSRRVSKRQYDVEDTPPGGRLLWSDDSNRNPQVREREPTAPTNVCSDV